MKKTEKRIRADLLPGILTMILLPLVAKGQKTEVDLGKYSWFPDGSFQYDFFMYWKSIVFLILVAAMLLVLIDRSLLRGIRIKNWKYFIPLYVYAGVTILSTILSADKALSLKGMWQQYESVWVLLGYLVTVFLLCSGDRIRRRCEKNTLGTGRRNCSSGSYRSYTDGRKRFLLYIGRQRHPFSRAGFRSKGCHELSVFRKRKFHCIYGILYAELCRCVSGDGFAGDCDPDYNSSR